MKIKTIPPSDRLLECQMQEQECVHNERYMKLFDEVNKLKHEKDQQQKLLAQSLLLPEDARIEASLNHEITRLTSENLVGLLTGYLNFQDVLYPSSNHSLLLISLCNAFQKLKKAVFIQ